MLTLRGQLDHRLVGHRLNRHAPGQLVSSSLQLHDVLEGSPDLLTELALGDFKTPHGRALELE